VRANRNSTAGEYRATDWRIFLPGLGLLLLLLVFYRDTTLYLAGLWSEWKDGSYSHGYIVILLSAYIIYNSRAALARISACPNFYALGLVALFVCVWTVAGLVNIQLVQAMTLLPLILSIILAVAGWPVLRKLLLPVLFIGLAIPVWSPLLPVLQHITAEGAYWFSRLAGIPALLEDFTIYLPAGRLSIADACSGLHYLLAGVSLGVFYAWLNYREIHHRLLVVALAVAASILANVLRVFIITWFAYKAGMQHPYVQDHLALGWYLFGALVFILLVLDLLVGKTVSGEESISSVALDVPCRYPVIPRVTAYILAALLIMSGPAASSWMSGRIQYRDVQALELPAGKHGWQGPFLTGDSWRPDYRGAVSQTAGYRRDGRVVYIYVGFYPRQEQGSELVNGLNRIAYPETWQAGSERIQMDGAGGAGFIEVEIESPYANKRLVWYRHRVAGRNTINKLEAKFLEMAGMLKGISGASVIAAATEVNMDESAAREYLADFFTAMDASLAQTVDGSSMTGRN